MIPVTPGAIGPSGQHQRLPAPPRIRRSGIVRTDNPLLIDQRHERLVEDPLGGDRERLLEHALRDGAESPGAIGVATRRLELAPIADEEIGDMVERVDRLVEALDQILPEEIDAVPDLARIRPARAASP